MYPRKTLGLSVFLMACMTATAAMPRERVEQSSAAARSSQKRWISGTVTAQKAGSEAHQRGDVPILEGHEIHKFPITISRLPAGQHEIGSLDIEKIGRVRVAVKVEKNGAVSDILTQWPADVQPEVWSNTTHFAYRASASGISASAKTRCELIHAGGQCGGCSQLIWIEVIYDGKLPDGWPGPPPHAK